MTVQALGAARSRAVVAGSLIVIALATVTACATSSPPGSGERGADAPLGSFTVSGPTFGQETLQPTSCVAGEREFFLGFDLRDERAGVITRLIVDPANGPVIRVFAISAPFDKTVLFQRSACRVLHFSLQSTGWRVNRIEQLDVSVDLDCQLPSGESIIGRASDGGCL
jgi:hypothetical protein